MSTSEGGAGEERSGPAPIVALESLPGVERERSCGSRTRVVKVELQRVKLYMKEPEVFDGKNC